MNVFTCPMNFAHNYQHSGFLFMVYFFLTVHSFVEMANFLLRQPGVHYIMSNKFCQDPLENFFGRQRMAGGRTDNPTIPHFLKATTSLRLQRSCALNPMHGNCRRGKRNAAGDQPIDPTPLPKRRRTGLLNKN